MNGINMSADYIAFNKAMFLLPAEYDNMPNQYYRNKLNEIFTDITCLKVLYTHNDKRFFGVNVLPLLIGDECFRLMHIHNLGEQNPPVIARNYVIELDSQLFNQLQVGILEPEELGGLILYSIYNTMYGHALYRIQDTVDAHYKHEHIYDMSIPTARGMRDIFSYGVKMAILKSNPLHSNIDSLNIVHYQEINELGYLPYINSALEKIKSHFNYITDSHDDRFITLCWAMRVIDNYATLRIPAYNTLRRAMELTGSEIEKEEIEKVCMKINELQVSNESTLKTNLPYTKIDEIISRMITLREFTRDIINSKNRTDADGCPDSEIEEYANMFRETYGEIREHVSTILAILDNDELAEGERNKAEHVLSELEGLQDLLYSEKDFYDRHGLTTLTFGV